MAKSRKRQPPRRVPAPAPAPAPPAAPRSVGDLVDIRHRVASPDGRLAAIAYDFREYRMGWYDGRIVLVDAGGAVVETFGGLFMETTQAPSWSPDGAWLAFPIRTRGAGAPAFAFIAWSVPRQRFAVVPVTNPYPIEAAFMSSRMLRLRVMPSQLEAANAQEVFGGGRSQAPVRRFRAPPPVEVDLDALALHERASLDSLPAVVAGAPLVDLSLVPDGFHPYDGPGLTSTTQRINGRPLEGHHLEDFAGFGDEVARAWLEELRERTGKRYDRWAPVAGILGARTR